MIGKRTRFTEEKVLRMADKEPFFCHRYKYSKQYLRNLCHRLARENKLLLTERRSHEFVYMTPDLYNKKRAEEQDRINRIAESFAAQVRASATFSARHVEW